MFLKIAITQLCGMLTWRLKNPRQKPREKQPKKLEFFGKTGGRNG
jgi:hypothetical protein